MPSLAGRALLGVTELGVVRKAFTATRPGRALASRFVAGETVEEAIDVADGLAGQGFDISLDLLGEHTTNLEEAHQAKRNYLDCLDRIGAVGLSANISVKLTQLGMGMDDEVAAAALVSLAKRAAAIGTTVTVDMEESRFTAQTISIYSKVQREVGNLGVALQAYLRRTESDLAALVPLGGHIRICKGAYAESEDVAFQSTREVDAAYDAATKILMGSPEVMPAIASHDMKRIDVAKRLAMDRHGPFEFQMLYGVRATLQRQLVAQGFPVRVYLPFGVAWYPYLTRRLAERPGNMLFFLRAVLGRR